MSLLLKLLADAARTHDGVVESAKRELEQELAPVATGPFELKLYSLQQAEPGNLVFGLRSVPVDRVLFAVVPTVLGPLELALPFSAKDTLGLQVCLQVGLGTPLHLQLQRGALGGWTSSWRGLGPSQAVSAEALRDHPMTAALREARVGEGLAWRSDLAGGVRAHQAWGVTFAPDGAGRTRLCVQTGTTRFLLARSFNVRAVVETLTKARAVLASVSALTPLPEVTPTSLLVEQVAERVAQGLAPVTTTPRVPAPAPGVRTFTPEDKVKREVSQRALWSLVLAVCSLPLLLCVPLWATSAWLGWTARRRALEAKLEVPFLAHAGLALSALSMLVTVLMLTNLPRQWERESREARRAAAVRAFDGARARAERPVDEAAPPPRPGGDAAERLKQLVERTPSRPAPRVVASSGPTRRAPATSRTVEP
jgi:hypothetical protein